VDDHAACFRFYRDVLGLEPAFGDETTGYSDFRAGNGSTLALFDRVEQEGVVELRPSGDGAALVFAVDGVDAAAERLADHVVAGPASRSEWGIRFVHLRDPDGHLVELNESIPMDG
jgi:lactoylglutathione lyase